MESTGAHYGTRRTRKSAWALRKPKETGSVEACGMALSCPSYGSTHADMCRSKKSGSKIRTIRRHDRISRSKIYRIPCQNHLVWIQELQDITTEGKFGIQNLQDPTSKAENQDPGSPGSHDEAKIQDARSVRSKIPSILRQNKL